ncbi:MAG: trigger factor [Candidatus Glassbacteria bacterium]
MADTELKVDLTESGPCEKTVNVTVGPDAVKSAREKVILQFRKEARIKGFRRGKAPRRLVEQTYAESIREELLQNVIQDSFQKAVEKEKVVPLTRPLVEQADLAEDFRVTFKARFEVSPRIELNRYRKFRIEKKVRKVTDVEVDKIIADLREQNAHFIPKTGPAARGDYLLLDFRVVDDEGHTGADGSRTNQLVMAGHADELALFSHALVGLAEGLGQKIEIDFPADYPDETLKSHRVTYIVDVKSVREKKLPELDDHFAKQAGGVESLDELKKLVRKRLEHEIEHRAEHALEEELFRQIIEANQFDIPRSLVDLAIARQIENLRHQRRSVGDVGKFAEVMRPLAEFMVKREYVIGEIARAEKIEATDQEAHARIETYAAQLGQTVEEVRKDFRSREAMDNLRSLIVVDKVLDFLKQNNDNTQVEDKS